MHGLHPRRPPICGRIAPIILTVVAIFFALAVTRPSGAQTGDKATVSAVRVGVNDGMTRLVFDVSAAIRFRVFTLGQPYRLVLDLPPVDWRLAYEMTMGKGGPIASFRYGAFTPGTNRVVVDLRRPVKVQKAFALPPKGKARTWRLVVDLEPVSKEEFERLLARQRAKSIAPGSGGTVTPSRRVRSPRAKPVIVLDPGHGGLDKGATSPGGVHEKAVVLSFAKVFQRELRRSKRYKVILTRRGDYYIPLRKRYGVARRAGADLFISLHADSNPFRGTRGLSVYTLSEKASDRAAAALARRENKADVIAGVNLKGESNQVANILIDLAQRETMSRSSQFAEVLLKTLKPHFILVDRAHRYAGFAVLKAPDVPSVLVEIGYLTNRKDARLLGSAKYQQRLAKRMVRAVDAYFARQRRAPRGRK